MTDGFYHVRKSFLQLPTLAEFQSDPRLAGGQVIMLIDRDLDTPLVTLEVRPEGSVTPACSLDACLQAMLDY